MKIILTTIFILLLSSCGIDKEPPIPISSIAGGDLDLSYNSTGFFTHHGAANNGNGTGDDEGLDIAIDSENRTVVVGYSINGAGNKDLAVWRLTEDGELDPDFNGGNPFIHNNAAGGNLDDFGNAVFIGPSDEIYVTGASRNAALNLDMVVWKLTPSGTLDTSLSGDGVYLHNNAAGGNLHDQGNDLVVDSNGFIFVTGFSDQDLNNRDMVVWKIAPPGFLDPAFSGDGRITVDGSAGGEDDIGNSIVLDANNEILVAGRSDNVVGNVADMAVWKISAAGALHAGFNGTGYFTQNSAAGGNAFDTAKDLILDEVGDIYVTGYSRNAANNNDMVVWKLSASTGKLDTSFNGTGYYVYNIIPAIGSSVDDTGEAISIDDSGNIMVVGSGNNDVAAWRLSPEGELDTSFNADGLFLHDAAASGFANDFGHGIYMDNDNGLLYMTGYSENPSGNFDMVVWRLD